MVYNHHQQKRSLFTPTEIIKRKQGAHRAGVARRQQLSGHFIKYKAIAAKIKILAIHSINISSIKVITELE
jgi:hypothetical protein